MVASLFGSAGELAGILLGYTQRPIKIPVGDAWVTRTPSLRWIAARVSEANPDSPISHQRLSEFIRNPDDATAAMVGRVRDALENPSLQFIYEGDRITYYDAPAMTPGVVANIEIPPNAVAFRFVVPTGEQGYNGFRSTEWAADFDRMEELMDYAPGGRTAITRIVFDTAEH